MKSMSFSNSSKRNLSLVFVTICGIFTIIGSNGGGGSDTPPPPSEVTVSMMLADGEFEKLLTSSASITSSAVVDPQSITITLAFLDGSTCQMSHVGSGEYRCTVSDYTDGTPFYINAQVGDLVLKSLVAGVQKQNDTVNAGVVNPASTLFIDVLTAFTKALDFGGNTPSVDQILSAVFNEQLSADLTALNAQIMDPANNTYDDILNLYLSQLVWANINNGGVLVNDNLAASVEWSNLSTAIDGGDLQPPTVTADIEAIKTSVEELFIAFLIDFDVDTISAMMADNYLRGGLDKTTELQRLDALFNQWSAGGLAISFVSLDAVIMPHEVDPDTYYVYPIYSITYADETGAIRYTKTHSYFSDEDEHIDGIVRIVSKQNQTWMLHGDGEKSMVDIDGMHYTETNHPTFGTYYASGTNVDVGFSSLYQMATTPYGTSEAFTDSVNLELKESDDYYTHYARWMSEDHHPELNWIQPFQGSSVSVHIAYNDTSDAIVSEIPYYDPYPVYPTIEDVAFSQNGTVTLFWEDISFNMEARGGLHEIAMSIRKTSDDLEVYEVQNLPFGTTRHTIPSNTMESGTEYSLRVRYQDIFERLYECESIITYP
jgi:hypothetical protein